MTVSELLRIADHLDPAGQVLVRKAFERASSAHDGQHRLSGEDYVNHPLEVAAILADLRLDGETIAAALLHDTVEDTNLTAEEVKSEFGPEVARLVEGVTKLGRISLRTDQQQQAENIRKMMVAMAEDLRVVLIKLADRLHNMRTLEPLTEPKRRKISRETLEIQIRTHDMHRVAEFGVAAHWTYKEGGKDASFDQKLSWLRSLLEWQNEVGDAESFLNTIKVDLFEDEVYVFTPRGDVINLPADSTPVDFAYRIHTEVGHRCIGAKVNGRMVPLEYALNNGEIVEVLTSKGPHGPSRDWLNFVKSASARDRIRKWFKSQARDENIAKGRDLLEKELHRMHRLTLSQLPPGKPEDMARHYRYVE